MAGEWRVSTWGQEISLEYGKALRGYDTASGKYRVFGSNGPIGWTDRPIAPGPGVILGRKGAYRGIEFSREPFFVIDTAYYVVPKCKLDMRWLYYAIKYHKLGEIDDGSPIPSTTRSAVYVRDFDIPPLTEQKAIAAVLGTLDDKIELNWRMNETLEAMARAIFKSWFVDFDPVRAKCGTGFQPVKGKGNHGQDGRATLPALPKPIADLFPASFQDSELGKIPKGWKPACLGEAVEIHDSKRIPLSSRERAERQGAYPYYGAAGVLDHVDGYLFDGIYVLMGEDGSVINDDSTPVVQYAWGKFWVNNHAHVLQGKNGVCSEHVMLHLRQCNIAPFVTGAVQPKLNQGNMNRVAFLLPSKNVCGAFREMVSPLYANYRTHVEESRTLAALRDALLPKLLSGEIRVASAKKIVEGVA